MDKLKKLIDKYTERHEAEQMIEAGEVLKDLIDLYDNLNNE